MTGCEVLLKTAHTRWRVNSAFDWQAMKPGDIVNVRELGADWGNKTLTHDFWRLVRLPWVHQDEMSQFQLLEQAWIEKSGEFVQQRKFFIDIDAERAGWLRREIRHARVIDLSPLRCNDFLALRKPRYSPFAEYVFQ